jgi:hypothetical protein
MIPSAPSVEDERIQNLPQSYDMVAYINSSIVLAPFLAEGLNGALAWGHGKDFLSALTEHL